VESNGSLICSFADDYTIYRIRPDGQIELILGMVRNRNYHFKAPRERVPMAEIPDTPINVPVGVVKRSDGTLFFIERRPQMVREYHPDRGLRSVFPFAKAPEYRRKGEAPAQSLITNYHPAYPGALALDAAEKLYLTDVRHGCVLQVDTRLNQVRRVIALEREDPKHSGGASSVGFGPDGTAWVLDSIHGVVRGYRPQRDGEWTPTKEMLSHIQGQALRLPAAGSGVAIGA
jgi:hypothetical protein